MANLPSGYTELEYIQSNGNQWIDTGFSHNQDSRIVMDVQATSVSTNEWLFEGRTSSSEKSKGILWYISAKKWCADYNGSKSRYEFETIGSTDRLKIDYDKNVVTINEESHTFSPESFTSETNVTLLACNTKGTVSGEISAKLYSCQIYDNGLLVRDFVPCIDPEGTVGLYDLVGAAFYGNEGTGEFTAGPEVVTAPPIYVNKNGAWEQAEEVYLKTSGVWKKATDVYAKQASVWETA